MKTWGRSRSQQRGFVMVVVIIIVALLALMGASIMNVLSEDMQIIGQSRRGFEARALAEGGVEIPGEEQGAVRREGRAGH